MYPLLLTSAWPNLADLPQINWADLPPYTNALWDIYYVMYLAAILDSSRKGGNFLLLLNNLSSKQSVSTVESCQM